MIRQMSSDKERADRAEANLQRFVASIDVALGGSGCAAPEVVIENAAALRRMRAAHERYVNEGVCEGEAVVEATAPLRKALGAIVDEVDIVTDGMRYGEKPTEVLNDNWKKPLREAANAARAALKKAGGNR